LEQQAAVTICAPAQLQEPELVRLAPLALVPLGVEPEADGESAVAEFDLAQGEPASALVDSEQGSAALGSGQALPVPVAAVQKQGMRR